jgi:hypothetical protein
MVRDAQEYLATGVEAGVVLPSRDPEARARLLAYQALGGMLVWVATTRPDYEPAAFAASLRTYVERVAVPALELFTQGLFVDRSMLDDYLMYVPDPPSNGSAAQPAT